MRTGGGVDDSAKIILDASRIPGIGNVFFLGPFVKRVSFTSQQRRALNLAWALFSENTVRRGDRVAVVGGGLCGLTVSSALLARGALVYLFDRNDDVLKLQRCATHRYVHPSINLWPSAPISASTTFPFFDWCEGECAEVSQLLYNEWFTYFRPKLSGLHLGCTITNFEDARDHANIQIDGSSSQQSFDKVIFALGFGEEAVLPGGLSGSYWEDDKLDSILDTFNGCIQVSGLGDGGLIETLRLLHSNFNKGRMIIDFAQELDNSGFGVKFLELEQSVSRHLHDEVTLSKILEENFFKLVADLPLGVREKLENSYRKDVSVELIGPLSPPYERNVAPIHQLLLAHAIKAGKVIVTPGKVVDNSGKPWIQVIGLPDREIDRKAYIARHGATQPLSRILSAAQIETLRAAQGALADYLLDAWGADMGEHCIANYPPFDRTSKYFANQRKSVAKSYIERCFNMRLKLGSRGDKVYYLVERVVGQHELGNPLPKSIFGIDTEVEDILVGDEYGADLASWGVVGRGGGRGRQSELAGGVNCLSYNDFIGAKAGNARGRVGGFVVNEHGNMLVLCARHVVSSDAGSTHIVSWPAGFELGILKRRHTSEQLFQELSILSSDIHSVENEIAVFRLAKGVGINVDSLPARENYPTDPIDALGGEAFVNGDIEGVVASIDATVCLKRRDGGMKIISGVTVVEIRGEAGGRGILSFGDSGSMVWDRRGCPLGIVIGGSGDKAFVAPLEKFLRLSGLRMARRSDILAWNAKNLPVSVRDSQTDVDILAIKRNVGASRSNIYRLSLLKRAIDVIISATALLFFAPVYLISSAIVTFESAGPAIVKYPMIGYRGKIFNLYKFRTFYWKGSRRINKRKVNSNFTSVGIFLIKTSLYELPMFFNVLMGDMSLVGPAPISIDKVQSYGKYFSTYCAVRPGMTGLSQINRLTANTIDSRVRLDVSYVKRSSLLNDFKIMMLSLVDLFFQKGVY